MRCGLVSERPERRRAIVAAVSAARIFWAGGTALDAVVATVVALEDHALFNAGYGSLLNSEGNVEMDASVMLAEPASRWQRSGGKRAAYPITTDYTGLAGAVAAVSRVRIRSCSRAPSWSIHRIS